jgi:hypothetical protein
VPRNRYDTDPIAPHGNVPIASMLWEAWMQTNPIEQTQNWNDDPVLWARATRGEMMRGLGREGMRQFYQLADNWTNYERRPVPGLGPLGRRNIPSYPPGTNFGGEAVPRPEIRYKKPWPSGKGGSFPYRMDYSKQAPATKPAGPIQTSPESMGMTAEIMQANQNPYDQSGRMRR